MLQCYSPIGPVNGQGVGLPVVVVVSNQSSAGRPAAAPTTPAWTYDPPVVFAISPSMGPTAGARLTNVTTDLIHYALGPPVVVTVTGANLGATPGSLRLRQRLDAPVGLVDTVVNGSRLLSWNHSTVVFELPPGEGTFMSVNVTVGGQASQAGAVYFSYDPPEVLGVLRYDRAPVDCQPRPLCFTTYGANGTTDKACSVLPGGCYDTAVSGGRGGGAVVEATLAGTSRGRDRDAPPLFLDLPYLPLLLPLLPLLQGAYLLAVVGESFGAVLGPNAATVTVGGLLCNTPPPAKHAPPPSDNLIVCLVPQVCVGGEDPLGAP